MHFEYLPIFLVIFIVSGSIHEWGHAYSALRLGDHTAEQAGRVTFDPRAHVDPLGLLVLCVSSLFGFGFGWMKPVPVNALALRDPRRDMMKIAAAGPAMNLVQAVLFLGVAVALGIHPNYYGTGADLFFGLAILLNVVLAFFNLLPVAPLDGFAVIQGLLPSHDASIRFHQFMRQWGPLIFVGIIMLPRITGFSVLTPVIWVANWIVALATGAPLFNYTALPA